MLKVHVVSSFCLSFSDFFYFSGHQRDDWVLICHCKHCPTVCQHCQRPPNCLPTLSNMAQYFCHHCQTLTNCLPALLKTNQQFANQWHSEHQINSFHWVRFTEMVDYQKYCHQIFFDLKKVSECKYATLISRQPDNSQIFVNMGILECPMNFEDNPDWLIL